MERFHLNPFGKEKQRSSDTGKMVGEVLGEEHEAAYRLATGEEPSEEVEVVEAEEEQIDHSEIDADLEELDPALITLKDIPVFSTLPPKETIKRDFDFAWVNDGIPGRPMSDFAFTQANADAIGLSEQVKVSILEGLQAKKESTPRAKVFEISDIIAKKQQEDPSHPNTLTTKEVLEAMDEAGYRPATLPELLAFARDHWKPGVQSDELTDEQKEIQHLDAKYIIALGSPVEVDGNRRVTSLWDDAGDRLLALYWFDRDWDGGYRFLLVSK